MTAGLGSGLGDDIEAACRSAASQALAATRREPKVCVVLYGNPLAVVEAGGRESYLRATQGTDPLSGSVLMAGSIPVGA